MKARDEGDAGRILADAEREIRTLERDGEPGAANVDLERSEAHEGHSRAFSFSGYEENAFFVNVGGGKFVEAGGAFGLARIEDGRGVAAADLDGDGAVDLVLRNAHEPALLAFRNLVGADRPSIELRLRGTKSNRFGVGARVFVETDEGRRMQELVCGEGYLSCGPPSLRFGLGRSARARRIEIRWPSRAIQVIENVEPGVVVVTEGEPAVARSAYRPPARSTSDAAPRQIHEEETAAVALRDSEGRETPLAGGWSVVCAWSANGASCAGERKLFRAFDSLLRARGGRFFAANVDDDEEPARALARSPELGVPVWLARGIRDRLLNPHEPLVPATLVFDPSGKLVARRIGPIAEAGLAEMLDRAGMAGGRDTRTVFEVYRDRVQDSRNQYYGTAQFGELREQLRSADPRRLITAHALLAKHYLRFSEVEKSLEHLELALALAAEPADQILILEQLAVASYRRGTLENCVVMNGPGNCILPFGTESLHMNCHGSEGAVRYLTRILELEPRHAQARWLLTLACMTLGRTPPGKWAVPLPASEYDIKRFPNVAPDAGITIVNRAGAGIMDDFDNDGLLDLVTTDAYPAAPMHYWHNDGNGKFTDRVIADQLGGLNATHADFDNDGFLDVLVLRGGWMKEDGRVRVSLLRNAGGTFEDVTEKVGLADVDRPTQTASWGDFDNDGWLDLFIGSEGFPCRLYRNERGRFANVTAKAGVENGGYTKGCAWGDYDNDGWIDLYVSNYGQPNRLYRNSRDGTFKDVAAELGVTEPVHSFPCWFFDYDNDGWLDLFVAGYGSNSALVAADLLGWENPGERPRLYRNDRGRFIDVTKETGLWHVWQPMGANFGDLDNDGRLDFYLGTGFPTYDSIVLNVMMRNAGTRFQDVTLSGGFGHLQKGHGVAWGDVDNDGDEDVFIEVGGFYPGDGFRNALFLNPGHGNRWIAVRLVGAKANRFGVGARIKVTTATREIHRVVTSGGSFGGNPFEQHIGLGGETPRSVEVTWPGGGAQRFEGVPVDAVIEIREGEAQFRTVRRARVKMGK